MATKSPNVFYAYLILQARNSSSWTDQVTLMFANVETADEWWTALKGNVSKWPSDFNMSDGALQRHGPQWFASNSVSDAKNMMRKIETDSSMEKLRGRWSFKATTTSRDDWPSFPSIPMQNQDGWPIQHPDESSNAIIQSLESISSMLKSMTQKDGGGQGADTGDNWVDGVSGPGSSASYQVVQNAFAKAKELKDSGDDRSFGMIFAQVSMELRRKV